jgi:hypothetical protein
MDNLGKNWHVPYGYLGGKIGSSLIFYFVAINDDQKSDIHQKCMPKPILARAQVPQRVTSFSYL